MTIRCLIVDDEPIARQIVENYASKIPYLQVEKSCKNAFEALEVLTKSPIDLMFLDINMPQLTGLSFLKTLKHPPKVVVTTAYQEYALEGFELAVTDYLLKPFSLERFMQAVERVKGLIQVNQHTQTAPETSPAESPKQTDYLFIKSDKRQIKVFLKDILFLEAYGNFVKVHTASQGMLLASQTLSSFESLLPEQDFMKTHKSFLVAIRHINYQEGNQIFIGEQFVPVGKTYKKAVQERFS